ncbi:MULTISPECIES: cardiolipin synthase [Oceanimonas]|uniref:Cardiolipin synthase A n=1 Tax=Oceanimonas doudoroffii TaxID=84158 RepID=A0A233REI6_9GAMM|nr:MULTISPECIES: cardiolipin synthase [Oceanimonas]NHI01315.1 Cardiolipin synthase A [Oceanimonas sp. MB9]OXY81806.1 cardiolipin synthase [Oceanimonas doudoroffii]
MNDYIDTLLGWLLFATHTSLVVGVTFRVIMKRRPVGVSLAWLALIYAIPILGVATYILFGEVRLGRKRAERARAMYRPHADWINVLVNRFPGQQFEVSDQVRPIYELVKARLNMPMLSGNGMTLLQQPTEILSSLRMDIERARSSCYLEFYIWHQGGMADEVAHALMAAARRGVDCRLLLDSVGSADFFRSRWPGRLREAGVKVVEVLPVGAFRVLFERQDLRMHRKLVVIDDDVAYTGSMNLVDPACFKQDAGVGQWVDIMLRIRGPIVPIIWSLFVWDWEMETGERLLEQLEYHPICCLDNQLRLQLLPSGPFMGGDAISQSLLSAVYQARRRLVLVTPYFVPDDPLVAALCSAADRGVEVQLLLPEKNDSRMVNHACNAFFDELLHAGVEIHLYSAGLLHTKCVLVDHQFGLVGTVNLDRRSFWLNFEMTLLVDDGQAMGELLQLADRYLADARPLSWLEWRQRPLRKRLLENLFYLLSPLL